MSEQDFDTSMRRWAVWRAELDELVLAHPRAQLWDRTRCALDFVRYDDSELLYLRIQRHVETDLASARIDKVVACLDQNRREWIHRRYTPAGVVGTETLAEQYGVGRKVLDKLLAYTIGFIEGRADLVAA